MVTADRAARDSLRMAIYECAEELGALTRQMDAGQRGNGVPFDEIPHVMVRMCVAGCILAMSGKLEDLEAEEAGMRG